MRARHKKKNQAEILKKARTAPNTLTKKEIQFLHRQIEKTFKSVSKAFESIAGQLKDISKNINITVPTFEKWREINAAKNKKLG